MARKAVTIEDRVREYCAEAKRAEIDRVKDIIDNALYFRFPEDHLRAPARRVRKPKAQAAAAAKLPGVE